MWFLAVSNPASATKKARFRKVLLAGSSEFCYLSSQLRRANFWFAPGKGGSQQFSPFMTTKASKRAARVLKNAAGLRRTHAKTLTNQGKMKLISPRSSSKSLKQFAKTKNAEALKTSLMFATLARTAAADSNVKDVEIKKVQEIMRRVASTECTEASINVAAKSHLFENMPLQQFVTRAAKCLSLDDRREVAQAIAEVCQADGRVSEMEAQYFNGIVSSLQLSAAELMFDAA